jgi:hypothetical protein
MYKVTVVFDGLVERSFICSGVEEAKQYPFERTLFLRFGNADFSVVDLGRVAYYMVQEVVEEA